MSARSKQKVGLDPSVPIEDLARAEFDQDYYTRVYPDIVEAGSDPFDHFMTQGWREGRNPNPAFNTDYYLKNNQDVVDANLNPLLHWIAEGREAGRPVAPAVDLSSDFSARIWKLVREEFDPEYYKNVYPDIVEDGCDPLEHYMTQGWREDRNPTGSFNTAFYLENNSDVAAAGINPLVHWVTVGREEGRPGKPVKDGLENDGSRIEGGEHEKYTVTEFWELMANFDYNYYLDKYPDILAHDLNPFLHYMEHGWREHRNPNPEFDTAFYLQHYLDIASGGINPFAHFVLHGRAEGRHGVAPLSAAGTDVNPDEKIDWERCSEEEYNSISSKFDIDFYTETYPEVVELGADPIAHYLTIGWRKGYDPNPDFSTSYYINRYKDIHQAGVCPFVHYCDHGINEQRETHSYIDHRKQSFRPLVTVIVPNYNHEKYLRQRLQSIKGQSYENLEIIILDDASTDDSQNTIRSLVKQLNIDAKLYFNRKNSGNVFSQWRKGIDRASGELIWICESDDFCEPDFLEQLVPCFADEAVNIAFGRIQFADSNGALMPGLDAWRERAEPGIWTSELTRTAPEWFNGAWGVNNVYCNVGGGVFRKPNLTKSEWREACTYRICGDWYLYLQILGTGKATFAPGAVAYFRQHSKNTSASNFHHDYYYEECVRIFKEICRQWNVSGRIREKYISDLKGQYLHFNGEGAGDNFEKICDVEELKSIKRDKLHVLIGFLGFYSGGGELFPISLANALFDAGVDVSMVAVDMQNINEDMRSRLNARIPVYHALDILMHGRDQFLSKLLVSHVNTHVSSFDAFLYNSSSDPMPVPYIVTLHGSFVGLENADPLMVEWITTNADSWIYTADRNLEFFENRMVTNKKFTKLHNAMPQDSRPATFTRSSLGISNDSTVFTLVARGIKRKGWRAAIEAFRRLSERCKGVDAHLLLIGDGAEADKARLMAGSMANVHFLGYQSEINGIMRLSNCLILPSRFEGESYPLCLIQALQEGVPAIANDIGEVKSMMSGPDGEVAGILLENQRDSKKFFERLADAMIEMSDPVNQKRYSGVASSLSKMYDIDELAAKYIKFYSQI